MRWVGEDQHRPGRGASARCGPADQTPGAPGTDTPLPPGDKAPWPSSPAPRSSGRKEPAGRRSRPYRIATDSASRPTTAGKDDSHQNAEAITAVATTATIPPYPTITGTSPTALTAAASRSSITGEEAGNSSGTPSLVPDQPHPRRGPPGGDHSTSQVMRPGLSDPARERGAKQGEPGAKQADAAGLQHSCRCRGGEGDGAGVGCATSGVRCWAERSVASAARGGHCAVAVRGGLGSSAGPGACRPGWCWIPVEISGPATVASWCPLVALCDGQRSRVCTSLFSSPGSPRRPRCPAGRIGRSPLPSARPAPGGAVYRRGRRRGFSPR